ncbi:MAG: acyltransferase [Pirellulales bacterium]|nr:acyltransferase [Pirellulales bacterium]
MAAQHPQADLAKPSRILELDALRGLAAVAVVLFHYSTRYNELFGFKGTLPVTVPWGHYGVDLFFMLSGFVILMTLERSGATWKFIWGRFSRLYPAYWAAVAMTFAAVTWYGLSGQEVAPGEALINLTMIQALLGAPHVDGAYWSLQAELIFYANMLVLYRLGAFRYPIVTVIGWIVSAILVGRAQPMMAAHWPWIAEGLSKLATVASLKYIPLFGIGILFYTAYRDSALSSNRLAAVAACLVAITLLDGASHGAIDLVLLGVLWLAVSGRFPVLQSRPFVALGGISYTLYLTHENIGYILIQSLQRIGLVPAIAVSAALLGSILLATGLHRWLEMPAMVWLRTHPLPSPRFRRWMLCQVNHSRVNGNS